MISCPSDTHTVCCTGTACYSPGKPAGGGRDEGRSAQTSLAAAAALSGGGLGGRSKEGGRYLVLGYVPAMLLRHPCPPTPSFVVEQEDVNHGFKKKSNPRQETDSQPRSATTQRRGQNSRPWTCSTTSQTSQNRTIPKLSCIILWHFLVY